MSASGASPEDELIQALERGFSNMQPTDDDNERICKRSATRTSCVGNQGNIVTACQVKLVYDYLFASGTLVAAVTAAVTAANKIGITNSQIISALLYFVASIADTGAILMNAAASQFAETSAMCLDVAVHAGVDAAQVTAQTVSSLFGYFTLENANFAADVVAGTCQSAAISKACYYMSNKFVLFQDIADKINTLNGTSSTAANLLQRFQGENLLLYTPDESLNPQPSAFITLANTCAAGIPISENLKRFNKMVIEANTQALLANDDTLDNKNFIPRASAFNMDNAAPQLTPEQIQQYCADQTIRDAIAKRRRIIVSDVLLGRGLTNIRGNITELQRDINQAISADRVLIMLSSFNTTSCSNVTASQPGGGRRTKRRKSYRKSYRKAYKKITHKRRPRKTHKKLLKRQRRRTRK